MSELDFEAILSQYNEEYQAAEEFNDWMPPDGEDYLVSVVKFTKGVSNKNDTSMPWWKLTGKIIMPQNAELDGQEFALGFYSRKAWGVLKSQAKALNNGRTVPSLEDAHRIIEDSVGKILRVDVKTSTAKNGNDYTNCYIKEVVAVEDDDGTDNSEPPQGGAPTDPTQTQ